MAKPKGEDAFFKKRGEHTKTDSEVITFTENFSKYPAGAPLKDGGSFGPWNVVFAGHGSVEIGEDKAGRYIHESPKTSSADSETHASLVVGPSFFGPLTFEADVLTSKQLRTNGKPNEWEVAWLVWNYTDNSHFYYFIPKPTGWELGKEDPSYPGNQRFLASGGFPKFPLNKWDRVKISQENNKITVRVNGRPVVSYTDNEKPYTSGRIGFYNEDASVCFRGVVASGAVADFSPKDTKTIPAVRLKN